MMSSDVEYLLLKDKGPYHDVCVRHRINTNTLSCKFYVALSFVISVCLLTLLISLVYVFVLVPSWEGKVLSWDGHSIHEIRHHHLAYTECGPIEGVLDDQVYVFKGIPYALPPVGTRRWQKPESLSRNLGTCWSGVQQAKQFGSSCMQPVGYRNYSSFRGSEDCLYLNIWTQSLDSLSNLPVMVWIHGGNLIFSSGNEPGYMPNPNVTKDTRAVYVSLNYRLGPFGFLTVGVNDKSSSGGLRGNYGLMDVIQALHWIKDNIRNFGGNPNKITIFGQGSGGTVIQALLTSGVATGLFHRAWLASPSAILNKTASEASKDNAIFFNLTKCADVSCLKGLSSTEVMKGTPWRVFPYWGMEDLFNMPTKGHFDGALLVVDGYVLKESPLRAWQAGLGNDMPVMFTTTAQETDLVPFDPTMTYWTWSHYDTIVRQQLTPFGADVGERALEMYPPSAYYTPEYQYTSMVSDIRATCPVHVLANATSWHSQWPVYRGVITSAPSSPFYVLNRSSSTFAFNIWDIFVFFGDFKVHGYQPSKTDLEFQKVLRQQMMTFARDGKPEAPVWQPYRTCTALLSDHVFIADHFNKERCDFWLKHGFFSYAWIN